MSNVKKLTKEWAVEKLPKRPKDANKGTFGKVLIIAGSQSYPGAAYLACAASYRVGAGLVTLATISSVQKVIGKKLPEVTYLILPDNAGVIGEDGVELVVDKLHYYNRLDYSLPKEVYNVLLIGPGLDQKEKTSKFLEKLLDEKLPTIVIDGDGLNILSKMGKWWERMESGILTPHPGEMARLTGLSIDEIQKNREEVVKRFAKIWNQVIVLKGANTVIASPTGEVAISPFANPALATAGTGDVLAGCIAGFLAQGLDAFDAACCGVYIHGLAGERIRKKLGDAGMLASDLLPNLPLAIKWLHNLTSETS